MPLPLRTHCQRCGLPQWIASGQAIAIRRLACPRCGHRASSERLRFIRQRARSRREPELRLAS